MKLPGHLRFDNKVWGNIYPASVSSVSTTPFTITTTVSDRLLLLNRYICHENAVQIRLILGFFIRQKFR